ncbi:protein of unknown function [Moritella yayanosii]|uniref:Uncharacterized protein n=1 Tax=Moritella yayanosii TaxID=69539 RepID=A0A330M2S7_9GAMM|nr:protein of unknown function [Moritella yayanosii]
MGERDTGSVEVIGSIPFGSTISASTIFNSKRLLFLFYSYNVIIIYSLFLSVIRLCDPIAIIIRVIEDHSLISSPISLLISLVFTPC